MTKRFYSIFVVFVLLTTASFAQWENQGAFPSRPDTLKGTNHAMATDPDGNVWVVQWETQKVVVGTDTLKGVTPIRVFSREGNELSFSPIVIAKGNGINDTLKSQARGMREDHEGNILITNSAQNMYRFNYKTGEAMNKVALALGTSPTAPAVDSLGNIYVAPVVPAATNPIKVWDKDFNSLGNALSSTKGFSRSFEVSKDGNTIYWAGYTLGYIIVYHRADEFSAYDSVAAILEGFHAESFTWNPKSGKLWISAGSGNDMPTNGYTPGTWYEIDPETYAVTDSMKWAFVGAFGNTNERPRTLAFDKPDGNIAYLGVFGGGSPYLIEKVVNKNVSVGKEGYVTANGYKLGQNYPNPFNPTTTINFSVAKEGLVTLKVYDMLGKEVAVLVNKNMTAGEHKVDFNASKLASGTYVYRLNVNGNVLSNKMMLMK